ncbi:class I SAM-dependent methyltransferase [bacterium]|nr:class I SAM-dependent methyltransferase [bacterium]
MNKISETDRENIFFYANEDAKYYDIAEELTQPHMDLIHDTMVDLIEYSLTWKKEKPNRPFYILDVASGTGAEAFRLLERFGDDVHIVAVDFSPPMNNEFKNKFKAKYPDEKFESKITLIEEDFFSEKCSVDELLKLIPEAQHLVKFDAVIAGFFLHHYPTKIKQLFFDQTYNLLRKNGVLVLCEAMSFQSNELSEYAHDFGEKWMKKQFSKPDEYLKKNVKALGDQANFMKKKWLKHWNYFHIYSPDNIYKNYNNDNKKLMSYLDFASVADYKYIGIPFRMWEAGILWAKS